MFLDGVFKIRRRSGVAGDEFKPDPCCSRPVAEPPQKFAEPLAKGLIALEVGIRPANPGQSRAAAQRAGVR
jgi:hypothetical protein